MNIRIGNFKILSDFINFEYNYILSRLTWLNSEWQLENVCITIWKLAVVGESIYVFISYSWFSPRVNVSLFSWCKHWSIIGERHYLSPANFESGNEMNSILQCSLVFNDDHTYFLFFILLSPKFLRLLWTTCNVHHLL